MYFMVDNMLPGDLVYAFRKLGHEARHTSRMARVGYGDKGIWAEAERIGAVVVSKDKDFLNVASEHSTARLVFVKFGNQDSETTIDRIINALPMLLELLKTNSVATID
jgi:predicted nuclease of predicted toxin-antitoxin system